MAVLWGDSHVLLKCFVDFPDGELGMIGGIRSNVDDFILPVFETASEFGTDLVGQFHEGVVDDSGYAVHVDFVEVLFVVGIVVSQVFLKLFCFDLVGGRGDQVHGPAEIIDHSPDGFLVVHLFLSPRL